MELWKKNPTRYKYEYFERGKRLKTRYLEFGNKVHEMIENGSYHHILPGLTVYPERELKIETTVNGVPVLAFIDGCEPEENIFGDYKTGKKPWTQQMLQKSEQMLFYATIFRVTTGRMPAHCEIHWLETTENCDESSTFWKEDRKLSLTGKTVTFRRHFDERELDRMEAEILKVAMEISEAYKQFINEL